MNKIKRFFRKHVILKCREEASSEILACNLCCFTTLSVFQTAHQLSKRFEHAIVRAAYLFK